MPFRIFELEISVSGFFSVFRQSGLIGREFFFLVSLCEGKNLLKVCLLLNYSLSLVGFGLVLYKDAVTLWYPKTKLDSLKKKKTTEI